MGDFGRWNSEQEVLSHMTKPFADITLSADRDGFFNQWSEQVRQNMSSQFFIDFSKLKVDRDRINAVWEQQYVHSINLQSVFIGKNPGISAERRQKGNDAFKAGANDQALAIYTQAVARAPHDEGDHYSLALANRSAVLFHMKEYEYCLQDIALVFNQNYPLNLHYKVYDRKGQCQLQLGREAGASESFKKAMGALKDAKLDDAKIEQWTTDLKKRVQVCQSKLLFMSEETKDEIENAQDGDLLFRGASTAMPKASSAVTLQFSKEAGRYISCSSAIPGGSVLFREEAFCSVLMPEKHGVFCCQCYKKMISPVPCKICSNVAFCSPSCRDRAMATYHTYECQFSELFKASGMSLNCYLTYRAVAERKLKILRSVKLPKADEKTLIPSNSSPYNSANISSVLRLVALESQRDPLNFLQRTLMCVYLLKVLKLTNYFPDKSNKEGLSLSEDQVIVGAILLRFLQVIQFNSHELSGICYRGEVSFKGSKSIYLGLALYTTVSFLNHSCDPAVSRYFNGKEMTIVSLRPLAKGEPVTENYGPVFTHTGRAERQMKLKSRYWFQCTCEACLADWPVFASMPNEIRLRCTACCLKLKKISISREKDGGRKCSKCGGSSDVEAVFRRLQGAHKDYDEGILHMDNYRREDAIASFLKYGEEALPICQMPFKDIHSSLQALRHLIFHRGTGIILLPSEDKKNKGVA